jgi:hypothetical protein
MEVLDLIRWLLLHRYRKQGFPILYAPLSEKTAIVLCIFYRDVCMHAFTCLVSFMLLFSTLALGSCYLCEIVCNPT